MKFIFLILSMLSLSVSGFTQAGVRLYAFKQAVSAGVRAASEGNGEGKRAERKLDARVNYFVYLVYPPSLSIVLAEIWINGESFSVRTQTIITTPIELTNDNPFKPEKTILVPQTKDKVLHLTPIEKLPGKNLLKNKNVAASNELIIVYKYKGKVFTKVLKEMERLPTLVMQ